jgi:hypothetical protein
VIFGFFIPLFLSTDMLQRNILFGFFKYF